MGWTQTKIAKVKGVNPGQVTQRLKYSRFPDTIMRIFKKGFMSESHAAEIDKVLIFKDLRPWLTRQVAMLHVVNNVTRNATFTANHFRKAVDKINEDAPAMGTKPARQCEKPFEVKRK